MKKTTQTAEGAPSYEHSMDNLLEFFSKGCSIQGKDSFYAMKKENALDLFKKAWYSNDKYNCMKLLFYCRDCRGGAGNRQVFRDAIKWLSDVSADWVNTNIHLIPLYGRWDDLKSLYGTECEPAALDLWANALLADDDSVTPLAAKWTDRQDYKLRNYMEMTPKAFRRMVVKKTKYVVEHSMCSGEWSSIEFSKVPSVASARYRGAFKKHQEARYDKWCTDLAVNKKVNTSVLFPHDIVRLVKSTNHADTAFRTLVDTMFGNLPDYIDDPFTRCIGICDFSGSMDTNVSGKVTALDVSLALGLYCGDRLSKDNPFYRKLIPFSTDSKLESWVDMDVVDAIRKTITSQWVAVSQSWDL